LKANFAKIDNDQVLKNREIKQKYSKKEEEQRIPFEKITINNGSFAPSAARRKSYLSLNTPIKREFEISPKLKQWSNKNGIDSQMRIGSDREEARENSIQKYEKSIEKDEISSNKVNSAIMVLPRKKHIPKSNIASVEDIILNGLHNNIEKFNLHSIQLYDDNKRHRSSNSTPVYHFYEIKDKSQVELFSEDYMKTAKLPIIISSMQQYRINNKQRRKRPFKNK
jgi:hypothetical protein